MFLLKSLKKRQPEDDKEVWDVSDLRHSTEFGPSALKLVKAL